MTTSESNSLPFEVNDGFKSAFEPGFYDQILTHDLFEKQVMPFEIKTSIHNCFACDNKKFIKPLELGNFDASVIVIGEVPSDVDFKTPEGQLLVKTLTWANYSLEDVYFTSLCKCETTTTPERCYTHLLSEILCVRPAIIISLGYDVGKFFDPNINMAGYTTNLLDKFEMITTYRTIFTMSDKNLYEEYCNHIMFAKHKVDNKLQGVHD
ncbi:uracil-DNA glycosylase family protein [Bacillus halotolerans]|uniref:Uracil-DNA glycosylase-like domain-containing protein n=1 Tax=Bacillus halotolerans TaxID=260554 RepID=A0A9Q4ELL4_9BACI|nr:uracil-DNA glycosylase family protein [Bacillus halotolerans]MCY9186524.1 hypothetical protein [Bacillus halotolerans]